jgi:hypothetical protein
MKIRAINSDGPMGRQERPTMSEVEAAVLALDGTTTTMITLEVDDDHHMGIGGGKDGQYVVYVTKDNLHFKNLEDASRGAGVVRMICGGQEGEYRAAQCVGVDATLFAARAFANTGNAAPDLDWVDG